MLPDDAILDSFFKENLIIWRPKDIVGGDTYYFHNDDESCYVMALDCTGGHGVPGAFMTMLVTSMLNNLFTTAYKPKPSAVLATLNKRIKATLKQYSKTAKSDSGLDGGGVLRYDKSENLIIYAGAKCELHYFVDGEYNCIKGGDRHSVGYIKSDPDYMFTDNNLLIEKEMSVYISTDGFIDQNGGEKGFPMGGKKKFKTLLEENHKQSMDMQGGQSLLMALEEHQGGDYERNDDVTLIAFKVAPEKVDASRIVFLKGGELTQEIIKEAADKTEAHLEQIVWAKKKMSRVMITFIEMAQNVFKYSLSKNMAESYKDTVVLKIDNEHEEITIETFNLTDSFTGAKIMEDVMSLHALDKTEIKNLYKDMRKSGAGAHDFGGAGIGFLEMAKQSNGNLSVGVEGLDKNQCILRVTVKI